MNSNMLKFVGNDRLAVLLGMRITKIDTGYAIAQMEINETHLNGVNIVHGGVIFALADYTFAAAANSQGIETLGINATISYFKAPQGKVLTAKAKEVSSGNKICNYNVDIFDETNELIARFNGTGYRRLNTKNDRS